MEKLEPELERPSLQLLPSWPKRVIWRRLRLTTKNWSRLPRKWSRWTRYRRKRAERLFVQGMAVNLLSILYRKAIEELKEKAAQGERLEGTQLKKIESEAEIRKEVST